MLSARRLRPHQQDPGRSPSHRGLLQVVFLSRPLGPLQFHRLARGLRRLQAPMAVQLRQRRLRFPRRYGRALLVLPEGLPHRHRRCARVHLLLAGERR